MVWVKLDDGFVRHPRMVAAGLHGRALFIAGLCYCGAHLTDGHIPRAALPMLAAEAGVKLATWRVLVDVGSWIDHGDTLEVHDFLTYNPSRAKVMADRDAAAERQGRFRRSRRDNGRSNGVTDAVSSPSPSRPVPEVPAEPSTDAFDAWWSSYPRKVGKAPAVAAFAKALKSTTVEQLTSGLEASKAAWRREHRAIDKIPHAATWLNQCRWEDEYAHADGNGARHVGEGPIRAEAVKL